MSVPDESRAPSSWTSAPIVLGANRPANRPYRGGEGIAKFRRIPWTGDDPAIPEDFVASTTTVHGSDTVGLTRLPSGQTLRDAVEEDPVGFLGAEHVDRHGADTMLLVKLLDTGERLFVHVHPDDAFAAEQLHERCGKTEAWIVVAVADDVDGYAAVGFDRDVSADELADWFDRQDVDAFLGAMRRVPLAVGDTLLVPAGIPHAIGPGLTLIELQQPQDLSILLEHAGRDGFDARSALLGLPPDVALGAVDRRAVTDDDVARLGIAARPLHDGVEQLFGPEADQFFRAEHLSVPTVSHLDAGFSVVVVTAGSGGIEHRGGTTEVSAGDTVLVPHGAGSVQLSGRFEAIRARPPRS